MTTVNPPLLLAAVRQIVAGYTSAVFSGMAPDRDHLDNGGYHVSIEDLRRYGNAGDYSNRNTLDKAPPVTPAGAKNSCAFDISMSKADMIKSHGRIKRVFDNRRTDTRAKYVNAVNCWDGSGDAVRYNFVTGTVQRASDDHTWHNHGEGVRAYVDAARDAVAAARAARAWVSMFLGQTHDAWQRQEKLGPYSPAANPTPRPPAGGTTREDDDDMLTEVLNLPPIYAYDNTGKPLPGTIAGEATLSLPLPPAGHKDHRWGKDYRLYLSVGWDALEINGRVQVSIHDGKAWHRIMVSLTKPGGARKGITVPAPAAQSAYNITFGRVQPKIAAGTEMPPPTGSIALLAEMIRN